MTCIYDRDEQCFRECEECRYYCGEIHVAYCKACGASIFEGDNFYTHKDNRYCERACLFEDLGIERRVACYSHELEGVRL